MAPWPNFLSTASGQPVEAGATYAEILLLDEEREEKEA